MKILSKRQIIMLHSTLIFEFGGIDGIREEALLESAIYAPFQTFDAQDLYPTILAKAATLCFGLIRNHPFIDGNKRIATHSMLVFLDINKISIAYEEQELIFIILSISSGKLNYVHLLEWLRNHII